MTFFQGGSVPDLFSGTIDADTILGGDGNDTLAGGAQGDFIDGEAGDDYLYSASVSPPYTLPDRDGLWTAPMLDNGNEADTINGGDGSDHIFAGYGDSVDGGADGAYGDYLYISFHGAPNGVTADFSFTTNSIGGGTITGIENISWVQGSNEADTITIGTPSFSGFSEYTAVLGMGGDDQLTAGYYTGTMDGGDGDDIVDGRPSQDLLMVAGGNGNDTLYTAPNTLAQASGGAGDDLIFAHGTIHGDDGGDNIFVVFGNHPGPVYGDAGDDVIHAADSAPNPLSGGSGADAIYGGSADELLVTADFAPLATQGAFDLGSEHDLISGGGGDDTIWAGMGDDVDGGDGTDTLFLSFAGATAGVSVDLSGITGAGVAIAGGVIGNIEVIGIVQGSAFDDRIVIAGLTPGATLDGGAGNDTIDGGTGVDLAIYDDKRAAASVSHDGGIHALTVSTGLDGADTLRHVEQLQFADGLFSYVFARAGAPVVANFNPAFGWASQDQYPRHVADVNGDGYLDIVGFGFAGVLVSFGSAAGTFSGAGLVVSNFGQTAGWASDNGFHRELADVNGDGRADILGFGYAGTLVSLAKADGTYDNPGTGIADFGVNQGWANQNGFARTVGDVNGDGKADLVGFGFAGALVALGNGNGTFKPVITAIANFGVNQGWTSDNTYHRAVADVNGDGKADIIGFGIAGTYVALSNGDGTFADAKLVLNDFGANQGWSNNDSFSRVVADVNGDHIADIVGFGIAGTLVAFGKGDGTFTQASLDVGDFGKNQGWSSDNTFHREVADVNHDGLADVIGFGIAGVLVGVNQGDFLV